MNRTVATATSTLRLGLDPIIAVSLTLAILFFLISGAIAYSNLNTLREDSQAIDHSGEVIVALDELFSSIQDAETGQRGFVLTNDQSYLEPYNTVLGTISSRIDELTQLTSDNPAQQARIPILRTRFDAKIAELQQTIDTRRNQGFEAALAIVNTDRGKVEMDAIRAQLAEMTQEEADLRLQRLEEMDAAYTTALTVTTLAGLLGIGLIVIMGFFVRRTTIARQREEWLQSGQLQLGSAVLGDQTTEQLGDSILGFLTQYLGATAGAIFVRKDDYYQRASMCGVPADAKVPEYFTVKEGLLGQAVGENRSLIVHELPDGYLSFGSALGQATPRHLVISPANVDGIVNTVIELGFIRPIDETMLTLLEQSSTDIAIAMRSAKYRAELQILLEESQLKSEELQAQGEELRVSNEELEEQGRTLKESFSRLEQQQVELEQTNLQLEEQTQQLESHRDDLERANAAVALKARELEQASQYKTDFLANMSHELRTPLNSSLILARLLADNPDENLTAEQVRYAQTIQSAGNDLLTLINDILDLSKIEAGHVEISATAVSLEYLADKLQQIFAPVASDKGIEFSVAIAPECPAIIATDLQRLEQVLKNLLSNALKFTEKGKVELRVSRVGKGQLAFSVTDTGIGIAQEQQQIVFEAFRQADGTISRQHGGTGLGLSISRELMRLLGGSIYLASQPGQGSTFTAVIPESYNPSAVIPRAPRIGAPASSLAASPAEIKTPPAMPATGKDARHALDDSRRILLIVEDDGIFAGILRDLSHEKGFQALIAGTAEEALSLATQYLPSAIVLDMALPDQSGLSVLDRLKHDVRTRHIPIHVISAHDHVQTALSLGAIGYMVKPTKLEQLVQVLGKLEAKLSQRMHRVLIVEDDRVQREAVGKLLRAHDVEIVTAGTAAECLALLKEQTFDCMVLDLSLPDASGYSLLETLSQEKAYSFPPVIVYTGRELSAHDEQQLRRYSKSIIIKGAKSPERLLDEVALFLHQVVAELPDERQKMIRKARSRDAMLEGRRILVVEDDVRNVYALANILEPRGALVEIARNGKEALEILEKVSAGTVRPIDLVLMDIMMPIMDGLTATREIRLNPAWKKLPIIALTAKAMPIDQQRCIEAGATDYMAKPLDVEKLLSLVRVWLPR